LTLNDLFLFNQPSAHNNIDFKLLIMNIFFAAFLLLMSLPCYSQTKNISYKKLDSLSSIINDIQARSNRQYKTGDGSTIENNSSKEDFRIYAHNYLSDFTHNQKVNGREEMWINTNVDLSKSDGVWFQRILDQDVFVIYVHFPSNLHIDRRRLSDGELLNIKTHSVELLCNAKDLSTLFFTMARLIGELQIQNGTLERSVFEEEMKDGEAINWEEFNQKLISLLAYLLLLIGKMDHLTRFSLERFGHIT